MRSQTCGLRRFLVMTNRIAEEEEEGKKGDWENKSTIESIGRLDLLFLDIDRAGSSRDTSGM